MLKNIIISIFLISGILYPDDISSLMQTIYKSNTANEHILINQLKIKLRDINMKKRLEIISQLKKSQNNKHNKMRLHQYHKIRHNQNNNKKPRHNNPNRPHRGK